MEAAVVSTALKVVCNKLAPLLIKECASVIGAKRDLEDLQDQFEEMNSWLETRYEAVGNDRKLNWLKRLNDVADDVDDIVDEFQLKAEEHDAHGAAGVTSRCMFKKPKSVILQCKAASKLKAVKKRFDAIVKQRTEFNAIANSLLAGHPARDLSQTTANQTTWSTVDVASVLGRDQEKHQIISKLVDDKHIIKTISIIGLAGSGKTTLAQLIFNDCSIVEKHFEVRLWVHVSQEFDVDKLIKKLFEAFADNNPGQHALPYMIKTISEKLTGKWVLLVLDDVWTESLIQWENFTVHLKSCAPGSRILLTARSRRVAETVQSTDLFDLPFLSLDDSWQLFQQSLVIPAEGFGSEFVEVGKDIVRKCGGLPLAIKALAGVLNGMKNIQEWQSMRDSNVLDVEGKEGIVSACLRLSYLNLPSHLKQCFTICSLFTKGHNIDKEQLIDLWIAHDMITPQAGVEFLDIGDKYFNSLVQMSFLQDVAEDWDGRVKCRMHDLVHDLALSILGDRISVVVPKEATSSAKSCRYFSLIEQPENLAPKNIFKKTRAVYIDIPWDRDIDYTYFKSMKHAKHLRSVMVGYVDGQEVNTISQVKYLKYVAMSPGCETLPKGISDVWSLQALHVTQSYWLLELPKSIGKLKMLRTLNLSGCTKLKCLSDSIGDCEMISSIDLFNCEQLTVLPGSIGNLRKLRTLNLSRCEKLTVLPDSIGRNEKLRVLRLSFTKIERLPSDITTLRNLECLDLNWSELVELPEGIGKLEKLQVLNQNNCEKLAGMPLGIGQLTRLQKLGLYVVGKGEKFAGISELSNVSRIGDELTISGISHVMDPNDAHMACLKEKTNLKRLVLNWMPTNMEEWLDLNWMPTNMEEVNTELQQDVLDRLEPPHRMIELEIHGYSGSHYARWMQNQVVGGVQGPTPFPFLRVMELYEFPNLKNLDGLVELPCLEVLVLRQMDSLESISGGPFPSLVKLEMTRLPCLGEVWMVAERTIPDEEGGCCCSVTPQLGRVWVGSCLTELQIINCPNLEVMPHLPPSLQQLELSGSEQVLQSLGQCQGSSSSPSFNKLKLRLCDMTGLRSGHRWELLQHMVALDSLEIIGFTGVQTELPESLWSLTSLRSLEIRGCRSLTSLPQAMGQLTSLQILDIEYCDALRQLPDCLGELCSLRDLSIYKLKELTCLPQSICRLTSLQELRINSCPGIKSLPEGMKDLTALKELRISSCPDLERRCEREKGEDWHLISHIPYVWIPNLYMGCSQRLHATA